MFQFAAGIFAIVAITYMFQLSRLTKVMKQDHVFWARLGQPSLFTLAGQRTYDQILYRSGKFGIEGPSILREINRTKWLQVAGICCFLIAAASFFVEGRHHASNNSFKPTSLRGVGKAS